MGAGGDNATINVYNNIIRNNTANNGGNDGDDLYVYTDGNHNGTGATLNLYNNDLGSNSDFTSGQSEDFVITVLGTYNQAGNITDDPMLTGDFHLSAGSPAINTGLNSAPEIPTTDFEGDNRIINTTVDIGADEYTTTTTVSRTEVPVPSITEWGSILTALIMLLIAIRYFRKKDEQL